MGSFLQKRFIAALALACCPLSLMAGAVISVDLADFDAGTIVEGQTPLIKHVYKIKNKGDSVLQVKSVKAG
jgi:hypothetical protein